jgi:hypothetical protein
MVLSKRQAASPPLVNTAGRFTATVEIMAEKYGRDCAAYRITFRKKELRELQFDPGEEVRDQRLQTKQVLEVGKARSAPPRLILVFKKEAGQRQRRVDGVTAGARSCSLRCLHGRRRSLATRTRRSLSRRGARSGRLTNSDRALELTSM